jgi:hypothetical protein
MGNQKKQYSGSIRNEKAAAKLYDKLAIKNLGLRAKTNFNYNRGDLIQMLNEFIAESDDNIHTKNSNYSHFIMNEEKKFFNQNSATTNST